MLSRLPQLRMGFTRFDRLAPPQLPTGYALRTFQPGDEDGWLALLATGDFGTWDRVRLDQMIAGARARLPLAGIFFMTQGDALVGTACTFLHQGAHGEIAELGWVVVAPDHRGHGLALQICRAVLWFIREHGHDYAFLLTEDFRLPAIKTYLRLGFGPEMIDPQHPAWWAALPASWFPSPDSAQGDAAAS